jgi:hypothetical protein
VVGCKDESASVVGVDEDERREQDADCPYLPVPGCCVFPDLISSIFTFLTDKRDPEGAPKVRRRNPSSLSHLGMLTASVQIKLFSRLEITHPDLGSPYHQKTPTNVEIINQMTIWSCSSRCRKRTPLLGFSSWSILSCRNGVR